MISHFFVLVSLLFFVDAVPGPKPTLETPPVTTLTAVEVAAYKPYTHYAAASYCEPVKTLAWNCGVHCKALPNFRPVASGGDGAVTQYWYVGYDSEMQSVIVAHQGIDISKILPLITTVNILPASLDSSRFPNLDSNIWVHAGFAHAHSLSAADILSAVNATLFEYGSKKVTIVGHSLGGAIAHLSRIYLQLHLPSGITFKLVTYAAPKVGNEEFARYFNAHVSDVIRINNKRDPVPTLPPPLLLEYHHVNGEKHILDSLAWVNCPGEDNTDPRCTTGYVPNFLAGDLSDHDGPYDGVHMAC